MEYGRLTSKSTFLIDLSHLKTYRIVRRLIGLSAWVASQHRRLGQLLLTS